MSGARSLWTAGHTRYRRRFSLSPEPLVGKQLLHDTQHPVHSLADRRGRLAGVVAARTQRTHTRPPPPAIPSGTATAAVRRSSYDLARLARNGLIHRIPNRNQYTLFRNGYLFAHIYTKVHDRVLRPLMAPGQPNAPPELHQALDTIDEIVTQRITHARVPITA